MFEIEDSESSSESIRVVTCLQITVSHKIRASKPCMMNVQITIHIRCLFFKQGMLHT